MQKCSKFNITYVMIGLTFIIIIVRVIATINLGGFFIDEVNQADTIDAIINRGCNIEYPTARVFGVPIFVNTDGGLSSIVFLSLNSIFASLFGTNRIILRLFMSLLTMLAIGMLSKAISYYYDDSRRIFWGAMLIGLTNHDGIRIFSHRFLSSSCLSRIIHLSHQNQAYECQGVRVYPTACLHCIQRTIRSSIHPTQ